MDVDREIACALRNEMQKDKSRRRLGIRPQSRDKTFVCVRVLPVYFFRHAPAPREESWK